MAADPDRLSRFWQELKRRRVVRVMIVYASAAYVVIELVNNVYETLKLPSWTPALILIILAIGFPLAIIFSWIFDLTPEGIKKTESIEEESAQALSSSSIKRWLKASNVIIVVLVVIVGILAFPRVFKNRASLKAMTRTVTVINEFGEKENRRIFKEDYITNLAIFPFRNESSDTMNNWVEYGIPDAVFRDLIQFNYVLVSHNAVATHLQEQIEYARTNNSSHFLTGSYKLRDGIHEMTSTLYQTNSGRVVEERAFRGSNFFSLIDSISLLARKDIGISEKVLNSYPDLPVDDHVTHNLDAFRHFITGEISDHAWSLNLPSTGDPPTSWRRAVDLDSTFALASWRHANNNYVYHVSQESAVKYIDQAVRHCLRLSEVSKLQVMTLHYLIHGESEKAIALAEMQCDLQPFNINILEELIKIYQINFLHQRAESATEQLNKLVPNKARYRIQLARSYLLTGKIQKGIRVLRKLLGDDPENTAALLQMGELYLHNNDLEAAEKSFQKAILLSPANAEPWSKMLEHINYVQRNPINYDFLEQFTCKYRFERLSAVPHQKFIHNNYLFDKPAHQVGGFGYPISDSVFTGWNGLSVKTFHRDQQNKNTKVVHRQYNLDFAAIDWIEDSLIFKALNSLDNKSPTEVLPLFREAYENNLEHYYLANYIQHLEYIGKKSDEDLASTFVPILGQYGTVKLYIQNGQYYYETESGYIHKLLPLNAYQFMVPNRFYEILYIEVEDNSVSGLRFVFRDRPEQFLPRNEVLNLAIQSE